VGGSDSIEIRRARDDRGKSQTAFLTGAATGIGMAIARKLDRVGWRVFAGVHRTSPDELTRGASDRLTVMRVDVADPDEVAAAAAAVEQAVGQGGLSLLISNAAMTGAPGPVESVNVDEFKQLMEVNFWGPLRLTQAFLPLLRRSGPARIVMVTSASVHLTIPLGCTYPTSKAALATLTRHLRMEMAPFGIEVTALEPGGVKTPMTAFRTEEEVACWEAIPPALLSQYEAAFSYPGTILQAGFEFSSPDEFAEAVYAKVISARKLKPAYTLGKGVAYLPVLHRILSQAAVERFFRRFFRVKAVC
jgi:NAD(P)-dependent dehydrogenase (short-subunit alcohol dehydrogenase family)